MTDAPIITSNRELIWIYIPVPEEATRIEIEKHIRDNAFAIAAEVCQWRDSRRKEKALLEKAEGTMVQ